MLGDNLPPPAEVVALYKQNNIGRVRIFFPTDDVLQALRGSNIDLILDVPSEHLQRIASSSVDASNWVQRNVLAYWPDVRLRYIGNIYNALSSAGLANQIKVSTVVDMGILGQSYPPSAGKFTASSKRFLTPIVGFLTRTGAPLLANVYPYFSYIGNQRDISLDYALFTSPGTVVTDGRFVYQNLFDAILDSRLAVGGGDTATIHNARTYNQNFIRHAPKGTPRRPGRPIEAYIFAMFNENKKLQGTEQNFGLFYPNKQPVYPISF
ncbi:unnamed protein product [Spirodela intermedia]|uniref:Uncharacterized protein n=1 Tax=Spirodela intermedia TaxID=51605 RepID=A0A7I8IVX8_SPIIN|nr:unnamed protein product [Spirodela intermedia]CAA6662146.1 unnamed protein product [Spirodela intermedia]